MSGSGTLCVHLSDMNANRERRQQLLGIKLRALVRDHLGDDPGDPAPFPLGASLVADDVAWVLVDEAPAQSLGRVLAWSQKQGVPAVEILAERDTGTIARHAAAFTFPVGVWHVDDRSLLPAVAEPLPVPPPAPPEHLAFRALIEQAGAEPVIEHGVLTGEVRGLEVCRAVTDVHTGEHRLEVGVGAHDREAFQLLHGNVPPVEALAGVVAAVEPHRRRGAAPHPLNRLAVERLLRWELLHDPHAVGAVELAIAEPPTPRANVRDAVPCLAIGWDGTGRSLAVVVSTGVDLSVVPFAVDARAATGAQRVLVVVPPADLHPVTLRLAALADRPIEVVGHAPAA